MNMKTKHLMISIMMVLVMGFFQNVFASDLIVVADESAQEMSLSWFGFLESKEIQFAVVTPEDFGNHKRESYIVIMGTIENTGTIRNLAKDTLSASELKSIGEKGAAFFKSDVWAPRQKVILFLGIDQEGVDNARKASQDHWYEMFMDWFDIEGVEGLRLY